jgi:non-heme chloroperoxidase
MDTYAEDLGELLEQLDLRDGVLVGHSSGAGDVTRYVGPHGTSHVAKIVLVSAIPTGLLKTDANPGGLLIESFDESRAGVAGDRSQFYENISGPFSSANRAGSNVSQGIQDAFWLMSMQAGPQGRVREHQGLLRDGVHRGPRALRRADADRPRRGRSVRPNRQHALRSSELVPGATLKVYSGAPHGLTVTPKDQFNSDLLAFIKS